jgi:hypothetical protein
MNPTDRARDPDPENPHRFVPRQTVFNDSLDHLNAKSLSMRHPSRPPPGRKDESRFYPLGNPLRFNRHQLALISARDPGSFSAFSIGRRKISCAAHHSATSETSPSTQRPALRVFEPCERRVEHALFTH